MNSSDNIIGRKVTAFSEEPADEAGEWYRIDFDNGMQLLVQAGVVWVYPEDWPEEV